MILGDVVGLPSIVVQIVVRVVTVVNWSQSNCPNWYPLCWWWVVFNLFVDAVWLQTTCPVGPVGQAGGPRRPQVAGHLAGD